MTTPPPTTRPAEGQGRCASCRYARGSDPLFCGIIRFGKTTACTPKKPLVVVELRVSAGFGCVQWEAADTAQGSQEGREE